MRLHTKTFALLHPWASTIPWDCLVRQTRCCAGPEHEHDPMANDPCAVPECAQPLLVDEECYAVIELKRGPDNREPWVCWRHVRPDEGPVRVPRPGGDT